MHYSIKNGFFMLLLLAQSLLAQPANEAAHYARVMQEAQHIVQQNKPDMVEQLSYMEDVEPYLGIDAAILIALKTRDKELLRKLIRDSGEMTAAFGLPGYPPIAHVACGNCTYPDGTTDYANTAPLRVEAYPQQADLVEMMAQRGWLINADDCLSIAARSGDAETVRILLKYGVNPHTRDTWNKTPLQWAQEEGRNAAAAILEQAMQGTCIFPTWADLYDFADTDNPESDLAPLLQTPAGRLSAFCWLNYMRDRNNELSLKLIRSGMNLNSHPLCGLTPLIVCCGNISFCEGHDSEWYAFYEVTPYPGQAEMVAALLAAGADPNMPRAYNAGTPLITAAQSGDLSTVKILLEAGARPEAKDYSGATAARYAAAAGHAEVLAHLLSVCPELIRLDPELLRVATENEHSECIRILQKVTESGNTDK